jgi:4-hydroxy-2-oxoglutarate aldolase
MAQITAGQESGADYALVLVPSIFHWAMNDKAIVDFFQEVADSSPLPIVIYNFPNLLSGLDVNSDMLAELGAHPNICAVKLTCGGIAKVTRVASQFAPSQFGAISGMSDWIVPALSVGGIGCISGLANLFPKVRQCIYLLLRLKIGSSLTHFSRSLLPFTSCTWMIESKKPQVSRKIWVCLSGVSVRATLME